MSRIAIVAPSDPLEYQRFVARLSIVGLDESDIERGWFESESADPLLPSCLITNRALATRAAGATGAAHALEWSDTDAPAIAAHADGMASTVQAELAASWLRRLETAFHAPSRAGLLEAVRGSVETITNLGGMNAMAWARRESFDAVRAEARMVSAMLSEGFIASMTDDEARTFGDDLNVLLGDLAKLSGSPGRASTVITLPPAP